MQRLLPAIAAMALFFPATDLTAQTPTDAAEAAPDSEATAEDIERLVQTLEDPAARAQLVEDLQVLLEARRQAESEAGDALPSATGIVDIVVDLAEETWDRLTSVDPRELLISTAISVGILAGALILRWLLVAALRRFYRRLIGAGDADNGEEAAGDAGSRTLPPVIVRLINLIIGVVAVALIAETWGAGLAGLLNTDLGARFLEATLAVGLILVLTVTLWNAAEVVVDRALRLSTRNLDRERTTRRVEALVPLLSSILQVTIGVFAGLLILSELGVNIGPLLAGAGILGLAVGFGAQTLVKDLITGVTILLEDGATVGDVVEVAGHAGLVEEMRIRVMQLRDLAGNVHLVPYSEVTTIKNFTKEFSYSLFDVGVAYREDTDEVCKVLHEIGDEMQDDEEFGQDILESLEILGVDQFADSAVIIKARIKTKPIRQWAIGREFNRRMKKRFDELGIEIPFPHTTLYFGEPKDGRAPPMQVAFPDGARALADASAGDD